MLFSSRVPRGEAVSPNRRLRHERGIWQRRYWEHTIRDDADYARHMDYIHFNPVKHDLVADASAWPYSSFRRCVQRGLYPSAWVGEQDGGSFGERP